MLDIKEIENTIEELENLPTTFDTCQKLANLYTVLDHYNLDTTNREIVVNDEIQEVLLPSYPKYCELKCKYQMGELGSAQILTSLSALCLDIEEFILTLYSTTDMQDERTLISKILVETLQTIETRK